MARVTMWVIIPNNIEKNADSSIIRNNFANFALRKHNPYANGKNKE